MTVPFAQATDEVWRLQADWGWAPWVTALLIAGAVALVVACYRLENSDARFPYRATLGGLRLTTIALLLLMLSEAVYSGSRTGKPRLAVLVDRSESMRRRDVVSKDSGAKTSRLAAAETLLTQDQNRLLNGLREGYEVELAVVDAKSQRTEALTESLQTDPLPAEADPTATRLGDAVTALLGGGPEAPLQGVLVVTDGQVTAGRSLAEASEDARRAGVPLYLVGVGDDTALPEARLADLVADETAFVDDLVAFRASLATRGLAGRSVRVDLYREGQTEPLDSQTLTPSEATDTAAVRLVDRPTDPGEARYTLRATTLDDDDIPPSELTHSLLVRDDAIRVLLAAGYPNYEFRYLKQLFERDETIRVSHHLQEADPEYSEADLTALPRMPVRLDDLAEYDAVVVLDLDPSLTPRSLWEEMGRFVGERGGGLVLVAGPRSLPARYRSQKAFVALAPTELAPTPFGAGFYEPSGYRVTPTRLGRRASSLELGDNPTESERLWRSLPPLYWRAEVGLPKPAAQVLATHPTARRDDGGPAPLIVSQFYGAGRVVLHAMDATYRWRQRVGDAYFARYWVQTLRSLARNKRAEVAAGLELAADKPRYAPGEPVRLRLRDRRIESVATDSTRVVLQSPGRPDRRVELVASANGRFETTLRDLPPGRYRALLAEASDQPVTSDFEVTAPRGEASRPEMNRRGLTEAAERSRGFFLTIDQADQLAEAIPPARRTALESLPPIELWNRWPLLAGITCCLTAEWVLRKRRAML